MKQFNFDAEKEALIAHFSYLKSLPVEEHTLRTKWDELQNKIHSDRLLVHTALYGIWQPHDLYNEQQTIADIQSLKPKILLATNDAVRTWWDIFRRYASTAEYNQPPTNHIRFLVVDENAGGSIHVSDLPAAERAAGLDDLPGRVLGLGAISGDVFSIKCRDERIGWSREDKKKKLRNCAIGSTIVPTNPFGANFLGGKLIAALTTSALLRNQWQLQYGNVLVGMTTTSLYGPFSMYNSLKWWKPVGTSKGAIPIQPDDSVFSKWREYLKHHYPEEYREAKKRKKGASGPTTNEKGKVLSAILRVAGISVNTVKHGHERGVYWSEFYQNTKEFLRGEISENDLVLKPLFQEDTKAILDWWRPKAIERYKTLKAAGRLNSKKLFYNHGYLKNYETFKAAHLNAVGK